MVASKPDFTYTPLCSDDFIRLLHILPAEDKSVQLCVRCIEHDRGDEQDYTAISYTWDNQQPTEEIIVNESLLLITLNAYRAIMNLRKRDREQCAWIDAICINQADDDEKIRQVRRMKEVYVNARETVVYLGEATPALTEAIRFVPTLQKALLELDKTDEKGSDAHLRRYAGEELLSRLEVKQDDDIWSALSELLWLPWFRRVWVIQEVAVSDHVVLHCGDLQLEWILLANACICLMTRVPIVLALLSPQPGQEQIPGLNCVRTMYFARYAIRNLSMNLSDFLVGIPTSKASDPKDSIFGILGLMPADKYNSSVFKSDYRSSTREVYVEATMFALKSDNSFDLLLLASSTRPTTLSLPSWVPDYSYEGVYDENFAIHHLRRDTPYQAGGPHLTKGTARQPALIQIDALQLTGHLADDVYHCTSAGPSLRSNPPRNDIYDDHFEPWMIEVIGFASQYVVKDFHDETDSEESILSSHGTRWGTTTISALWRTLTADCNPNRLFVEQTSTSCEDHGRSFWLYLMQYLGATEKEEKEVKGTIWESAKIYFATHGIPDVEDLEEVSSYFRLASMTATCNRRFAVTSQGRFALVPGTTHKDDAIVLLQGAPYPFVIRREADSEDGQPRYSLIGDCYVHGIMYGEAFNEALLTDIALV